MGREYRILKALHGGLVSVPEPIFYHQDPGLLGVPFYIMHKVDGVVLRTENLKEHRPSSRVFTQLSKRSIEQLVEIHKLDVEKEGIASLGKPEGYVSRQVEGWISRYHLSVTDDIPAMGIIEDWVKKNGDFSDENSLIHNDFKYDNLILNREDLSQIEAILDWEMATIGHPLMDLGTTVAYWVEEEDPQALKAFNTTWMPGNMSRNEMIKYYEELNGKEIGNILFYAVFGFYKIAVIAQQIYKRFILGKTKDPRFAMLIYVIKAAANKGVQLINKGEI
jgi:aminoglycoside phosphotransferase (APT) family kinase protein